MKQENTKRKKGYNLFWMKPFKKFLVYHKKGVCVDALSFFVRLFEGDFLFCFVSNFDTKIFYNVLQ